MEARKVFKPAKKFVNQQFLTSAIMLIGGVIALANGVPHLIGMGILVLIIAFYNKNRQIIKLFDNNMELKLSPLGSTTYIKYADIEKTEKENDKKIFIYYKEGDKTEKFRLPVHLIEKDDLTEFLKVVESKKIT